MMVCVCVVTVAYSAPDNRSSELWTSRWFMNVFTSTELVLTTKTTMLVTIFVIEMIVFLNL